MKVIVFAGPSIASETIANILPGAEIKPPAKQGDLYLAVQDKPQIIVLIDGFFERIPAVWHKEVLYAMSSGIHVYGCSSMGALRAAELSVFGMVGAGKIFAQYANGKLEDDDEVALIHAPVHLDYQPISRAMVDLRNDLQRSCEQNILSQVQAEMIEKQLKMLWYPYRTLSALYQYAESVISPHQLDALRCFLGQNPPSLKQQDAVELLGDLAQIDLKALPPKQVDYCFCDNDAWQTLIIDVEQEQQIKTESMFSAEEALEPQCVLSAKLRAGALAHAKQLGLEGKPWVRPAFDKVAEKWQCLTDDGKPDFEQVSRTIFALSLTVKQFDQWIEREALLMAYTEYKQLTIDDCLDSRFSRAGV
ncbi:TfuA-like protein [Photobacterium sp. OFAV2-7]|uniref:TfuA-like protein n=1 Tax=Photobacterium sp. OFAV2-7 TaxID=2917748 RepID=UPI001EF6F347|nr:TfuA-like protein [Photobacterium sp. OFAV2-7]MCG7587286.1 hypothetical protein [Photobacterium sp. OFAV2-7]